MAIRGLGRLFDIAPAFLPVDLNTSGAGGLLASFKNAGGATILVAAGAQASGTETLVLAVREAKDGSGTDEQDLDVVTEYWIKKEATLDGDEQWARVTQTAGDITISGDDRDKQLLVAFYIDADDLSDGFTHVTVDAADPGSVARLAAGVVILHDLKSMRAPQNLPAPQ